MQYRQLPNLERLYLDALMWLRANGVSTQGRFDSTQKMLRQLKTLGALSAQQRVERSDEFAGALRARHEAADLVRVHQQYGGRPSPALFARLKRARKGPVAGVCESATAVHGRNLMAELGWGAVLESCGFHTCLEHDTDVLQVERLPAELVFAWEVKRPSSASSLSRRCREGRDQIDKACSGEINKGFADADAGLLVVVLDRLVPVVPALATPRAADEVMSILAETVKTWVKVHRGRLHAANSRNCLGVVVWLRTLGLLQKPDGVTIASECSQIHFEGFRPQTTDDWRYQLLLSWTLKLGLKGP